MSTNKQILIGITIMIAILLITIGLSYAYFSANLTGGEEATTITVTGGTMNIVYNGGANINVANIIHSDNPVATKIFTVTGNKTTDVEMKYQISLIVEENTFSEEALKYKLISINTDNNGEIVPSITEQTNIGTGAKTIELGRGEFISPTGGDKIHTYSLEIYFPNANYNQNIDQGKEFKAYISIENTKYLGYDAEKGVNRPVLFTGMTPIKWDNENNEIETNKNDPEWYDYNNKRWANAKTADGSYWVWIPRYAYKILSGYHSDTTGEFDIIFMENKTIENKEKKTIETNGYDVETKNTSQHYFLHPDFVFGEEETPGFWVAKYEPTAAEGVSTITGTCEETDNVSTKTVKIIPNATSWRCISVKNAFDVSLAMKNKNIYGWNNSEVDTHLIKNIEWGAVAYLTNSKYGANQDLWNNAYNQYKTGCAGSGVNSLNESVCIEYNTENGVKASTTHNITGIYDMSGGSYERISGYLINGDIPAHNLDDKYTDLYESGTEEDRNINYEMNKNKYGDAIYETSSGTHPACVSVNCSWNKEWTLMPLRFQPNIIRGGLSAFPHFDTANGLYFFSPTIGTDIYNSDTFRPVIVNQ